MIHCSEKTVIIQALRIALYVTVEKPRNQLNNLLYCENYSKQREAMMNNVRDLVSATKSKKSLRITELLILAPYCEDISKKDTLFTKEALFEFISCCKRNI